MFKGFYNLTSGMITQGRYLDVISNNMTNIATPGYKVDRFAYSTFDDVMWSLVGNKNKKEYTDIGTQSFITAPSRLYTDYSQGSFEETGQPLDFAIDGAGYFAIQTDNGISYTRNGNFSLDDEGYLTLPGQGRVLNVAGNPILMITDRFETDGLGGMFTEEGNFLGRIGVFDFPENQELTKNGQALFAANGEGVPTNVRIYNKLLERSNVEMVEMMTAMIQAERAYQSAAQALKIYDEVIQRATTSVGQLQ